MKIDGKEIASEINQKLTAEVAQLKKQNIIPHLAIVLVGEDLASQAYVRQKVLKAEEIGAKATVYSLESGIRNQELINLINELNHDVQVHGVIIQRPLPEQINEVEVSEAVDPKKDIDAFHSQTKYSMPLACAVLKILKKVCASTLVVEPRSFEDWLKAKEIVVVGKGRTGGGPIIEMFKKRGLSPVIIDSKTMNPELLTKSADIIISTVGKSYMVKPEMIKKEVILISVGLHKEPDGKLHGDYEEEEIKDITAFYTPTPGGVGPVNVACLLENLIKATNT